MRFFHQGIFVLRNRALKNIPAYFRKKWFQFGGMKVGVNTILPKLYCTWPHQVSIGNNCRLERDIFFKFDGIWQSGPSIIVGDDVFLGQQCEFNIKKLIRIGNHCLIASGCKFIDHDHGILLTDILMKAQAGPEAEIFIGNNVWLGCNVVILKGVSIGDGAVVAAGAVVTKSIMANEIWGGVPAKKIGDRKA